MKRILSLCLAAALLMTLCACGKTPVETSVSPAEAAEATPEPEEIPAEEPGAGRVLVHMRRDTAEPGDDYGFFLSAYVPEVRVALREGVGEAISAALEAEAAAFESGEWVEGERPVGTALTRTCRVPRQDKLALTVIYDDAVGEESSQSARSFSTLTGERFTFDALSPDTDALLALCGEYAEAMTGSAMDFPTEDGAWYLSAEGLAFLPDGFAVPYSVLSDVMYEECMPPEEEAVRGNLSAAYAIDAAGDLTVLDELTVAEGFESVILWSDGTLRDVSAVRVEGEDFAPRELLWSCSRMEDGEAVRFNITLPETTPDLKLPWGTDKGIFEALLSRNGVTGSAELLLTRGIRETSRPNRNSPYAYITAEDLYGHWSNGESGMALEELSLQNSVCYVWNGARELEGACFRWELVWPRSAEECPQIVICTGGDDGDLSYPLDELTETTFHCPETDSTFVRSEAVG